MDTRTKEPWLNSPLAGAYEICKLQASADGAFPDALLWHWFEASWDFCAVMIGFTYPPERKRQTITQRRDGTVPLLDHPSSDVRIYSGPNLVAILPPDSSAFNGRGWRQGDDAIYGPDHLYDAGCNGLPNLCCYCNLVAEYTVGEEMPCGDIPPRFLQAVARLFTFILENRGDVQLDEDILKKCGAFAFLSNEVTFAL